VTGELGHAKYVLETDASQFKAGLQQAEAEAKSATNGIMSSIKGIGDSMTQLGSGMKSFGSSWTMNVTAPILGTLGVLSKAGMGFDAEMHKIANATGLPADAMDKLEKQILSLTRTTAVSPDALGASAFEILAKNGGDVVGMFAVLDAAAQQNFIHLGSVDQSAHVVIDTLNAYGLGMGSASAVTDMYTVAVEHGIVSMDNLNNFFGQSIALLGGMGIQLPTILGMIDEMAAKGVPMRAAGSSLQGLVLTFGKKPSRELVDAFKLMGLDFDATLIGLRTNAAETLNTLAKAADAAGVTDTLFGGDISAAKAFTETFGSSAAETQAKIDAISHSAGATATQAAAEAKTAEGKIRLAWAGIKADTVELGHALLPVLASILTAIHPLFTAAEIGVHIFEELPMPVKIAAVALALIAAAIGPVVFGLGMLIFTGGQLMGVLAGIDVLLTPEIGLILLAVGAFVLMAVALAGASWGLIWMMDNMDKVGSGLRTALRSVGEFVSGVAGMFVSLGSSVMDTIVAFGNWLGSSFVTIYNGVINTTVDFVTGMIGLLNPFNWIFGSNIVDVYKKAGDDAGTALVEAASTAFDSIEGRAMVLAHPIAFFREQIAGLFSEVSRLAGLPTVQSVSNDLAIAQLDLEKSKIQEIADAKKQARDDELKQIDTATSALQDEANAARNRHTSEGDLFAKRIEAQIKANDKRKKSLQDQLSPEEKRIKQIDTETKHLALLNTQRDLERKIIEDEVKLKDHTLATDESVNKALMAMGPIVDTITGAIAQQVTDLQTQYIPSWVDAASKIKATGDSLTTLPDLTKLPKLDATDLIKLPDIGKKFDEFKHRALSWLDEHKWEMLAGVVGFLLGGGSGVLLGVVIAHLAERFLPGLIDWFENTALPAIVGFFTALPGHMADAMGDVWGWIKGKFETMKSSTTTWLTGTFLPAITGFFTSIPGFIVSALGNLGDLLLGAIKGAWNTVVQWADDHIKISVHKSFFGHDVGFDWDPDLSGFKSYKEGAWDVPETQLALLHRREMVIPEKMAEGIRASGGSTGATSIHAEANISAGMMDWDALRRFVLTTMEDKLDETAARTGLARRRFGTFGTGIPRV
jgi:hypothetical protein